MANAPRFPQLALPFAILGAAAGWLIAGLLANPVVWFVRYTRPHGGESLPGALMYLQVQGLLWQGSVAVWGALGFAVAGALLTFWCRGKRYAYAIDEPGARPPTDSAPRHALTLILSGAVTGVLVNAYYGSTSLMVAGVVLGGLTAILFLPIGFAVIAAARHFSRARPGSLVAGSDRRAMWGILAFGLSAATLLAIPDWPASNHIHVPKPMPAGWLVIAMGVVTAAILVADALALRRARRALAPDLSQADPMLMDTVDGLVPCLDLGLGDEVHAELTRSAAAYRARDRALSVVQGSPMQAVAVLRRSVVRGAAGLLVIGAVFGAHMAAAGDLGYRLYADTACKAGNPYACFPFKVTQYNPR